MAEPVPQKPVRGYSFTDHSALDPDVPHKGDRLDQEYDRISASIQDVIDFIRQVITDDGYVIATSVDVDLLTQVARDWASAPEGVEVNTLGVGGELIPTGEYSAKHHAAKAAAYDATYRAYRDAAADSASAAATSASNANSSKNAANNSKNAAASSATAAADSATAAAGSASAANNSKNAAATSASNANNSKNAAATSATNAANSASAANNSKNAAATSATNAANSAQTAQTAEDGAVAAQTGVSAAQAAAEAARDEALTVSGSFTYARAIAAGSQNMIVNPTGVISQENARATLPNGYIADQWRVSKNDLAVGNGTSYNQGPGYPARLELRCVGGTPVNASHKYFVLLQDLEGFRLSHLAYGRSEAQTSTICFIARSKKAGTYTFSLRDHSHSVSFLAPITVPENNWVFQSIQIPPPPGGDWSHLDTINRAAVVGFCSLAGSQHTGVAGWQPGDRKHLDTATNMSSETDNLEITGVVWALGQSALTHDTLPAAMRSYAHELHDCQRYYWRGPVAGDQGLRVADGPATNLQAFYSAFPATMRSVPSMSILTQPTYDSCTFSSFITTPEGFSLRVGTTGAVRYRAWAGNYAADARF